VYENRGFADLYCGHGSVEETEKQKITTGTSELGKRRRWGMARYLEINQQLPRRQNIKRRIARPALRLNWREWMAALSIVLLLLLTALLSVWSSGRVFSLGYEISTDLAEKQKLIDQKNALDLEILRLKNPERLEVEARRFGFVKPEADQFIMAGKSDGSAAQSK
jgi:hypothetical protein